VYLIPAGVALLLVTVAMAVAIVGAAAHPVSNPSAGSAGQPDYRGGRDFGATVYGPGAFPARLIVSSAGATGGPDFRGEQDLTGAAHGSADEHDYRGARDLQSATGK
jgi:hypothetical protein